MPNSLQKNARNQTMECFKMIAAIFVVFIHEPFPGDVGTLVTSIARFAVPMFFGISGYFNYRATSRQVLRRLGHILRLMVVGLGLSVLWSCYTAEPGSLRDVFFYLMPDAGGILRMLVLHVNPYPDSGQLWYLMSLVAVYFVLWLYTAFYEDRELCYRPLYCAGFTLFAMYFAMSLVLPLDGAPVPYQSYRNGWFTGIPMFLLGLFLHEYQDRILKNYHLTTAKLVALAALGFLLTLLQWKAGAAGEIPLGVLLQVPALLLLMARFPSVPFRGRWVQSLISKFGSLSTGIYVLHLIVQGMYRRFAQAGMGRWFGGKEAWLRPLVLVALSMLAAIAWERLEWLLQKGKANRKKGAL